MLELTDLDKCISEVAEEIEASRSSVWCKEPNCSIPMLQRVLKHLRRLETIDNETI